MKARRQIRDRFSGAIFCLLATALLYAPFAAAVVMAHRAACCTSDQCPLPMHHHKKSPSAPPSTTDCGHNLGGLGACSMSCCRNPEKYLIGANVFLLPQVTLTLRRDAGGRLEEAPQTLGQPRAVEPLSPPPRIAAAVT